MEAIVAADLKNGIGKGGKLLTEIREDMRHFRRVTDGKILIYGRKTLETFPGGKALPKRRNLMLTKKAAFSGKCGDCCEKGENSETMLPECFPSPEALMSAVAPEDRDKLIVIGGESIYRLFFPQLTRIYLTRLHKIFEGADCFFPDLDSDPSWELVSESERKLDEKTGTEYTFCVYERKRQGGKNSTKS